MEKLKPIIIIFIIVIIIIILDIVFNNYTDNSIEDISYKLNEIDLMLEGIDKNKINDTLKEEISQKEVEKKAEDMVDNWQNRQKKLNCYIEHNEIEKISDKMHLIEKQIEINAMEDARQSITEAKYILEHLKEKQKLSIINLF